MAAMPESWEHDPRGSLALLEIRLRRLEFLLTGQSNLDGEPYAAEKSQRSTDSVLSKLSALQVELDKLRRTHGPVGDLVRDIESIHARVPESSPTTPTVSTSDLSAHASIVLSHATLYPETASRLSSLQTLQVPPAEQSATLSDLSSSIEESRQEQDALEIEIQDLRQRSARCLEWWIKVDVVGMGDLWDEWEDRITDIERYLARLERRKREQEGYL